MNDLLKFYHKPLLSRNLILGQKLKLLPESGRRKKNSTLFKSNVKYFLILKLFLILKIFYLILKLFWT